jgi:hypothetical protein
LQFSFLTARSLALAQGREGREGREECIFWPAGPTKTCCSLRPWRFNLYFFTTRSLRSLKGAKVAKNVFFGPQGQQKHAFLRVLRDLRDSSFSFFNTRSLRFPGPS